MPIKFRCKYCRQYLGISRSRAGHIVDCPTCGRSLRVPGLDGTVEPLPDPGLNLKDSSLASALNELAEMGREPLDAGASPVPAVLAAQPERDFAQPLPAPQPVVVEPPAPAVPVHNAGSAVVATGPAAAPGSDKGAAPQDAGSSPLSELAGLAAASAAANTSAALSTKRPWKDRLREMFPWPVLLVLLGATTAGLLAGWALGRAGSTASESTASHGSPAGPGPGAHPAQAASRMLRASGTLRMPALKGQITYRTVGGMTRADAGARIIVLPEQRTAGRAKLSIVGLRPADPPEDLNAARAWLRALGGDVAVADEDGQYTARLPRQGTYHVILVSKYQGRGEEPVRSSVKAVLQQYVDDPDALIGRLASDYNKIIYNGTKPETWNHTFEPPT